MIQYWNYIKEIKEISKFLSSFEQKKEDILKNVDNQT